MEFGSEPIHDNSPRTTATSQAEGRMKDGLSRKKKRKIIRKKLSSKNFKY